MKRLIDFSSRFRILKGGKISLVVSALLGGVTLSVAAPVGGTVTSGSATITQNGNITNVVQSTQKASINWQSFSIGTNEIVNFNQLNSSAIALNRVIGNERSVIDGALNANGQVWILNSNGVLFGKNASINTAGLLATTAQISDIDFQNGNYNFKDATANSVINEGTITISDGGSVILASNEVQNAGTIEAIKGKINIVGADSYTLNLNGNSLLSLKVDKGVLDALVENSGNMVANGGEIYLSTNAINELLKGVVNNTGIIEANSVDGITGYVELTGEEINLKSGSQIYAKGTNGGGKILVGGDWQGNGDLKQATTVTMENGAKIDASATKNGDGGTVVLWSDVNNPNSYTQMDGEILATGAGSGMGGKVETSGHVLGVTGVVNAGVGGEWLLDPVNITIANSGGQVTPANIVNALNSGTSVTIDTTGTGSCTGVTCSYTGDTGFIRVSSDIVTGAMDNEATLHLKAHQAIYMDENTTIDATQNSNTHKLNVILQSRATDNSGGLIEIINGASIKTNGGTITLGGSSEIAGGYAVGAGDVYGIKLDNASLLSDGGDIILRGSGTASAGQDGVLITGGTNINSGTGSIFIVGKSNRTGEVSAAGVRFIGTNTVTSAFGGQNAITIYGNATDTNVTGNNRSSGIIFENDTTIAATGEGGGINITGIGTSVSCSASQGCFDVIALDGTRFIASSGHIYLNAMGGSQTSGLSLSNAVFGSAAGSPVTSSESDITITADKIDLKTGLTSQSSGTLTIQPYDVGTIMSFAGASTFDLDATEIGYIQNSGASSIIIGGTDSTGAMTIYTPLDFSGKTLSLRAGSISDVNTTNRTITADVLNLTTNAGDIGGADSNNAIDFLAPVVSVNTTGSAYLKSTAGNGYVLGASNVGGTLSLSANGNVSQSGAITAGTLVTSLPIWKAAQLNLDTHTNTISALGDIRLGGSFNLTNGNSPVTVTGTVNTYDESMSVRGAVSIDAGAGAFGVASSGRVISGDVTIIADDIDINGSGAPGQMAISAWNNLILKPMDDSRNITLGGNVETANQFVLQSDEMELVYGKNTIIGSATNSGTMTIGGGFNNLSSTLNLNAGSITDSGTNVITVNNGLGRLNLITNNSGANIGSDTDAIDINVGANAPSNSDFTGVSIITNGNGSAYLSSTSTSGFGIGSSNVGSGTLYLISTGGPISETTRVGDHITAGRLKFVVPGHNVTFGHTSNAIDAIEGQVANLIFKNALGVDVGATAVSGNLTLDVAGETTSSGALTVTGTSWLRAAGSSGGAAVYYDMTLDQEGTDFGGGITVFRTNNLTLRDTNDIHFEWFDVGLGTLHVTAGQDITQTTNVDGRIYLGNLLLNAGRDILLTYNRNMFMNVGIISARDAQITNGGDLALNDINVRTLVARADGRGLGAKMTINEGATITASNNPTETGNINSVVLVTGDYSSYGEVDHNGRFINNAGADAVNLTGGNGSRWLIYSNYPFTYGDQLGGLISGNEAIWSTYYPGHLHVAGQSAKSPNQIIETGNRYVFRSAPPSDDGIATVTVTGGTKTYGYYYALSNANNVNVVYSSSGGSQSFTEFLYPVVAPTDWLNIGGMNLSSNGVPTNANVGRYPISVTGTLNGWNIDLQNGTWSYTDGIRTVNLISGEIEVVPRVLQIGMNSGIVNNKAYDGTTTATLKGYPFLSNVIAGDTVTIDRTQIKADFEDKNVGYKRVVFSNIILENNELGNYVLPEEIPTSYGAIARLNTVRWTGGNSGNWFDPANWEGGAVPDLSNVANVIIPEGVTVNFDENGIGGDVQGGTVILDSLKELGSLNMVNGELNVAGGGINLNTLNQSGGEITSEGDIVVNNFIQSGGTTSTDSDFTINENYEQSNSGAVNTTGNTLITDNEDGVVLGNIASGNLEVESTDGDIAQEEETTILVAEETTLEAEGDIVLDGEGNDFQGPVNAKGDDIALVDGTDGIILGDIESSGNLEVESTDGGITQEEETSISINGDTTMVAKENGANADVILDSLDNDFTSSVSAKGDDIALVDGTGGIILGDIESSGNLEVESTDGDIIQKEGTTIKSSHTPILKVAEGFNIDVEISLKENETVKDSNKKDEETTINNIAQTVITPIINSVVLPQISLQNSPQKSNNLGVQKPVIIGTGVKAPVVSQPLSTEATQVVTSDELSANVGTDIRVPLRGDSIIELVNGGVNLPVGVEQLFFIAVDEKTGDK